MEEQDSQSGGSYGGKTVGAFSGGIYIYLCNLLPPDGQIKEFAVYAAPCVAVWGKEWGGMALYEIKMALIQKLQHVKLNRLKAKIDSMPDVPGIQEMKKEVSDKFYKVSADIFHAALDDIAKMSSASSKKMEKKSK